MAATNNSSNATPPIIRPQGGQGVTLSLLPTRGEKQLVPSPITVTQGTQLLTQGFSKGQPVKYNIPISLQTLQDDFGLSAALAPLTDFVVIYIQNRGADSQGNPLPTPNTTNATFRFLINPATVSVSHSTLQSESFDRSGWQFGVWGEDMVRISMSGKTPGQYFVLGLTDEFAEYSQSYRNLEQIQDVFENNGYFFEGESVNYGSALSSNSSTTTSLPAAFTRRVIKMHQDVILAVKEFIWYGMFEDFSYSQDANNPYLADWSLTFIAWKEQFRSDSPYYNAIPNGVQRGNAYKVYSQLVLPTPASQPVHQQGPTSGQSQTALAAPAGSTTATSPAQQAQAVTPSNSDPVVSDYSNSPTVVMGSGTPSSPGAWANDFLGILD
jgi:hypothetical protein